MRLTLSFDNGPDPDATPRVLDVLARRGVRAHFFVLGRLVATAAGRDLVARAVEAGHLVGNHSFSHETPLGDDPRPDAVAREIAATDALLAPLVPGPRRFRPFGGGGALGPHLLSPAAVAYLCDHGHSCVLWNAVPRDWVDPAGWVATALADLATRPHTLLVLHDVPGACLDGLDDFVAEAQARGVELTTELPSACVPIVDGQVVGPIDPYVRKKEGTA